MSYAQVILTFRRRFITAVPTTTILANDSVYLFITNTAQGLRGPSYVHAGHRTREGRLRVSVGIQGGTGASCGRRNTPPPPGSI